jgi:uncharacterized Rmd1/YagE family protein
MAQTLRLSALLVAGQLDIRGIKLFLEQKPAADTSSELFYSAGGGKYQYYFNYGVAAFAGYSEEEIRLHLEKIRTFQRNPATSPLRDDHEITFEAGRETVFNFDELVVGTLNDNVVRITMGNLAQSVALDYYHYVTENLLTEIKGFTRELETEGRLKIKRKNMLRFIGRALNTQIDIAENIYIFDAPDLAWDDEYLDKLHHGLIKHFDLKVRFSEVEYTLRIIEDNLTVFRELSHQRESNLLEIIIIILILFEVVHLLVTNLF